MTSVLRSRVLLPLALLGVVGCEKEERRREVEIPVVAFVGTEPFACGSTYTNVGASKTTYEPMDFRVYVHDVRLLTADGQEVPVELEDSNWQSNGVVLLDFANKDGLCTQGTEGMNTSIKGTVPLGDDYHGVRFTLGVPETLNHGDVSTAPAPLNDTGLFWSWRSGYLFTRIEGRTPGLTQGHVMHLGSTDCAPPPEGQTSGTAGCTNNNRPEVKLDGFNLETGKVVMDLGAFFSGSNLDTNATGTAEGCMSSQADSDCAPLFERLGLGFGAQAANPAAQSFIRAE
ncbi:metallo-mystery pair system four-Cys motif protein [Corallococcus praedator]|uniref:Metallo-mystery pair system four-Cys motif protein n=1 Tax=Corallococcus praedator TaxID=2316724 RepID=A0ABX9Q9K8_9BACT|nr:MULTISPECIES: MbnP family copper-binding protein [Corallococcus]RKH04253.1 metallo-mystery pair system four-Cys motif protein [Corallococcus sp. CA047B]RKH22862.1 metallo-mystery pair system four-Cys motif protein [Corallococcus sp. CA031C]RKH96306.1 metallo-mystery pair system four-Cys motif protein [Corallococcus praedator]